MKRPLAVIGFSYLAVLLFLYFSNKYIDYALLIISAVGIILSFIPKTFLNKRVLTLCFITVFVATSQYTFFSLAKYQKVMKLCGKESVIVGEVVDDYGCRFNRNYYVVKVTGLSNNNVNSNFKVRIGTNTDIKLNIGDKIKTTVVFRKPPEKYGLNSVKSNQAEGIFLYATLKDEIKAEGKKFNPNFYAVKIRQGAENIFNSNLSEENASVMNALVLGNKDYLSAEDYQNFRNAGTIHLLVVSGLHIGIIMSFFLFLFKKIKIRPQISALITIPIVLSFVALTGFSVSATRAGIMSLIYLLSIALMKKSDSLNSLGLSVFVMLVLNPFTVISTSFLLSVFATLGITLFSERLNSLFKIKIKDGFLKNSLDGIIETLSQSFSANIAIFPFAIMILGSMSIIFPVTNILMIPFATLLLVLGFLFLIIAFLNIPILTPILKFLISILCKYNLEIAKLFGNEKFVINLNNDLFKVFLAVSLAITGIYLFANNRKKMLPLFIASISFLFITTFITASIIDSKTTIMSVLDVDNGVAVVIKSEGKCAVIGCGGNGLSDLSLRNKLEDLGIKEVDYFILPRNDYTFSSQCGSFLWSNNTKYMLLSRYGTKTDYSNILGCSTEVLDDEVKLNDKVKISLRESYNGSVVKVNICDMDVLISSNYADFNDFEDDFRSADFMIATDYKKSKADIACDTIILSSSKETYEKKKNRLLEEGFTIISTVDNGDIDMNFKDGSANIID